jgi:hypothetical protein
MYNNGNSSKNVTGASIVDGTVANVDIDASAAIAQSKLETLVITNTEVADNAISGDKIDAGIISNFQSTGIDDRSSTTKNLTLTDSTTTVTGNLACDGFTSTGIDDNSTGTAFTINSSNKMGFGDTSMSYPFEFSDSGTLHEFILHQKNASWAAAQFYGKLDRAASQWPSFILLKSSASGASDTEFNLKADGNAVCDGSWSGGGADYAEYFEWSDGNPSNEDRRGISVVLDNEKIRPATGGESPIGVISARPAVVGDNDMDRWKQKYLRSDFGDYVFETYTVTEWEEQKNSKVVLKSFESDKIPADETVPSDAFIKTADSRGNTLTRRKINPDYDESQSYTSREERQEWDTVGLMGKLRIIKGQATDSRWIKMRDVSDTVEEWLVL